MDALIRNTNIIGVAVANAFYLSAILVFILRLINKTSMENWIGIFEFCLAVPMIYLLIKAPELNRHGLYYLQIALMLAWLVLEFFLDYLLKIDFRQIRWVVIVYITLFFAGTGGMLGIAAYAGRGWSISSVILFLIMAVLAFVQRGVTGM